MDSFAIHTEGITKSFGALKALDSVSLDVARGEIFGLIGPDGAGKTTLFRILTTLMLPDEGRAEVCGFDIIGNPRAIRFRAGYMPGRFSLYPDLTVEENLRFYASLFGGRVSDNFGMVEPVYRQLEPFRNRRAGKLSGGMKQKLALCCALIHKPEILFLDEPTTGVDAVSRSEFWDILSGIKQGGMPIIVSTPYMDEASRCDRIALMNAGRILETGSLDEILSRNDMPVYAVRGENNYRTLQNLRHAAGVRDAVLFGEYIHVFAEERLSASVLAAVSGVAEVKGISPNIEDVFINIMGHGKK
ncbi:ABC transporter ATP-binding protein [Palleniella muris]|uniref:ABC transporter ATP-binding protein n=1 Tax=Palleniella muris TaxID=3038145 RepID=A0AC61QS50_9BACT|nr:ABC transporter ATP-binding protein [Palleniella muris]TGX83160.1 ABC transporter ATP-binding protein [Palleniella muris]